MESPPVSQELAHADVQTPWRLALWPHSPEPYVVPLAGADGVGGLQSWAATQSTETAGGETVVLERSSGGQAPVLIAPGQMGPPAQADQILGS